MLTAESQPSSFIAFAISFAEAIAGLSDWPNDSQTDGKNLSPLFA
tara:strand:+ start:547 stop:681 length:135 start_codon:yes stop_codon:yes gene_type:complete